MSTSPAPLLQAPRLTGRELVRPRLRMARGTGVTEVWAAAGTGKTTLLALWAAELRSGGEPAAWISLPAAGRPGPRLAALARTALASSREAEQRAGPRAAGSRATLLIDDLDHLTSPAEGQWLADLIESPPRDVRIVLAGRHPPQVLADHLADRPAHRPSHPGTAEYRTGDLAFTSAETAAFLAARGIQLAPRDVDSLHQRTGGWAAALTLLAGLVDGTGQDFEAGHQSAADYLGADILDLLPATYLSFLLAYLRIEFRSGDLAGSAEDLGSAHPARGPARDGGLNDLLTPKEREILRELPRFQTVRDIAARQRLSPNTVKTHIRSLYQKLGVTNRAAAIDRAFDKGLL